MKKVSLSENPLKSLHLIKEKFGAASNQHHTFFFYELRLGDSLTVYLSALLNIYVKQSKSNQKKKDICYPRLR